jgi:hypothetical protein
MWLSDEFFREMEVELIDCVVRVCHGLGGNAYTQEIAGM